jgi:hypothetical protein
MVLPIYAQPKTPKDVAVFQGDIAAKLKWIEENQYDENFNILHLPVYPAKGGLFPFLNDIDGPLYCWLTEGDAPDQWPVYCWLRGPFVVLEGMTIADMFLGFMERLPEMVSIWGDIRDFEPDRLRIDDCCAD